jgi:hypothetical protein
VDERQHIVPRDERVFPRPAPDLVEDGVPATEEVPEELLLTGDVGAGEGPSPPLDRPQAVNQWGTTSLEEREGEPLDVRLRREQPDVFERPEEVEEDVPQVFQPGAENLVDEEPDEVGDLDAVWEDSLSAEELALRIDEEPPGLTYDESPDYIEDD